MIAWTVANLSTTCYSRAVHDDRSHVIIIYSDLYYTESIDTLVYATVRITINDSANTYAKCSLRKEYSGTISWCVTVKAIVGIIYVIAIDRSAVSLVL